MDPHIQFGTEDPDIDGSMPILDTHITPGLDNTLLTTGYRKSFHIDLYLHRDSHHNLIVKYGVFNALTHRARTVFSNPFLLKKQKEHIKVALQRCNLPSWVLNRLKSKNNYKYNINNHNSDQPKTTKRKTTSTTW